MVFCHLVGVHYHQDGAGAGHDVKSPNSEARTKTTPCNLLQLKYHLVMMLTPKQHLLMRPAPDILPCDDARTSVHSASPI